MKTSGFPCPLDQLYLKRSPFARTYLTELIKAIGLSGKIQKEKKKACTVLIHKKIMQIPLQIFVLSLLSPNHLKNLPHLCNSTFPFLLVNNFMEHNIPKRFTPHILGTFEQFAQMARINQARKNQFSLIITLIELENVFGAVNDNGLRSESITAVALE